MKTIKEVLADAAARGVAVGHFNISDLVALRAIVAAARERGVPVVIGTSEGERDSIGPRQAVALVQSLREEYDTPIFLNADHTRSFEKAKEAIAAGYDAVLFDGSALPFEENVRRTKEVVAYARSVNGAIAVEGEIGYIGSASEVLKEVPKGAALKPEELTSPEQARDFVLRTGVDLFAPAVGNIHGIVVAEGFAEKLDIERIRAIRAAVSVPLVLHGASGLSADDLRAAVAAGINMVHVNTELRVAWREGMEQGLRANPGEVAPYKIYPKAFEAVKAVVADKLSIFNGER